MREIERIGNGELGLARSILRSLVRIPTENPPGDTREAVAFLYDLCKAHGLSAVVIGEGRKQSILVEMGKKGPSFMLNAHLDTVPAGDHNRWTVLPFEGTVKDGRLYGRGAADNKGGVTAALLVLLSLNKLTEPDFRVYGMFVADEEAGGKEGTGKIVADGYLDELNIRAAIVCDGSGLVDGKWGVRAATKGVLHLEITIEGTASHAARPAQGRNAVLAMSEALLKLSRFSYGGVESDELLGLPTLVAGTTISGGSAVNGVPGTCEATVDCRLTPGISSGQVVSEVRKLVETVASSRECRAGLEVLQEIQPIVMDHDDPILGDVLEAIKEVTNQDPAVRGLEGSNDARYLAAKGIPTIPGLSPSDSASSRSHGVDENVDLEKVVTASKIYAAAIRRWAGRFGYLR